MSKELASVKLMIGDAIFKTGVPDGSPLFESVVDKIIESLTEYGVLILDTPSPKPSPVTASAGVNASGLTEALALLKQYPKGTWNYERGIELIQQCIDAAALSASRLEREKVEEVPQNNMCKECNRHQAVKDYNGHQHWVCEKCYDSLSREFDREYN